MIVDFAPEPWSEIIPGLWQGGHDWRNPKTGGVEGARVEREFDLVVSLFRAPGDYYGPTDRATEIVRRIPDGELDAYQLALVDGLGRKVAAQIGHKRKVLVRCQAGLNRSGLVVAYALIAMGHAPADAIDLIRAKRSPYALTNKHFVGYLTAQPGPASAD